jgi:hypothetical protein
MRSPLRLSRADREEIFRGRRAFSTGQTVSGHISH